MTVPSHHPRRRRTPQRYERTLVLVLLRSFSGLFVLTFAVLALNRLVISSPRLSLSQVFETRDSGIYTEVSAAQPQATASADMTPPVISGVQPILAYEGDAVSYRAGVCVTDDRDLVPTLNVDTAAVDLSAPGTYPVIYEACDDAGNVTRQETTLEVRPGREGYASMEEIYQIADGLLAELTYRDQPQYLQVYAIYDWLHENCSYVGHSDKSDPMQAAYLMLTQRRGDCFNYYAASKLLFDRLGIKNMDVRKEKAGADDSDHYWSLVSLDCGKTWYHFDATPRLGQEVSFCLTSDAVIDEYSDSHHGSHNRDKSLYPATPEAPYGE